MSSPLLTCGALCLIVYVASSQTRSQLALALQRFAFGREARDRMLTARRS